MKLLLTTIAAVLVVGCGKSPIHSAARDGNIEAVKQHLAAGTDVNTKQQSGWTALHYATIEDHKEIVELLIAEGADVNAKGEADATPLYLAASNGHKAVAALLIAAGADVNAEDHLGETPLDEAIYYKHPETADLLRKHGGKAKMELEAEKSIRDAGKDEKTSALNGELQNALQTAQNKNRDYDLQIKTLNGQIADKDRTIDDIGRRLESAEEDRDHLINERNKLIAEKAELEKQFQDILALRQKVQQLQFELNQSLLRKHGGKTGAELKAEGK